MPRKLMLITTPVSKKLFCLSGTINRPKFSFKALETVTLALRSARLKFLYFWGSMIRGIIIFALLGVALAAGSANQYMDNVLHNFLPNELRNRGLNPAPLPAFIVPFGYPQMAQANFFNGNATVVVNRYSNCQGPRMAYGEITVNCTLSLSPFTTLYTVRVTNGSQVYNARSIGHAGDTLVSVVVAGRNTAYVGYLKQLQVTRVSQVTPTFTGLPPSFSKYVPALQAGFRSNVNNYLFNLLQNNFAQALAGALSYTPMPKQ